MNAFVLARRLYSRLAFAPRETHIDLIAQEIAAAVEDAKSKIVPVPMPEHELEALIDRNTARKLIRARIAKEPWLANPGHGTIWTGGHYVGRTGHPGPQTMQDLVHADFIVAAHNDTPEDDIDQLLALIADLQAALQER